MKSNDNASPDVNAPIDGLVNAKIAAPMDTPMDAPMAVLGCISTRQAKILKSMFQITTIRDFANHKLVRCISALSKLEQEREVEKTIATDVVLDEALAMTFPASDPTSIDSIVIRIEAMH